MGAPTLWRLMSLLLLLRAVSKVTTAYEVHSTPTLSPWRKWLLDMFSSNGGPDIYDLLRERNYDCPNFPDIDLPHLER